MTWLVAALALSPVSNTDALVISAAMGSFFDKSVWSEPYWNKGDYVVLDAKWASQSRSDFRSSLDAAIVTSSGRKQDAWRARKLERLRASIKKTGASFQPGPIRTLNSFRLDRRVLVGSQTYFENEEAPGRLSWSVGDLRVKNQRGAVSTVRAIGMIDPPGYSRDGKYACVTIYGLPWSIHKTEVRFFLARTGRTWRSVHAQIYMHP